MVIAPHVTIADGALNRVISTLNMTYIIKFIVRRIAMKIYALNGMQSHCESVKKNVSLVGSIVLRGFETANEIELLEGSHRMAYAIELGLPITIVLFDENEIIPHDCYDDDNPDYLPRDYVKARHLAHVLIKERGLWNQAIYESDDFSNIKIIKPIGETGEAVYSKLISKSPFSAFPQKIWEVIFGEIKDVVGKNVLVFGDNHSSEAFKKLGANVIFVDSDICRDIRIDELNGRKYDLIYATNVHTHKHANLNELFTMYRRLLKDDGLAVTLNDKQTPEIILGVGLNIYWFTEAHEKYPKVSFVKQAVEKH